MIKKAVYRIFVQKIHLASIKRFIFAWWVGKLSSLITYPDKLDLSIYQNKKVLKAVSVFLIADIWLWENQIFWKENQWKIIYHWSSDYWFWFFKMLPNLKKLFRISTGNLFLAEMYKPTT